MARPKPKEDLIPKEVDDGLKYQIITGKSYSEEMSKALKRDVMTEKLHMKKKWLIAYNVAETKEELTFWTINSKGEEEKEVRKEELGKGVFIKGFKKIDEDGEAILNFEELITII